jgi:tight adherence protein C
MKLELYLVPILTFLAVMAVGAGILLLRSLRQQSVRDRLGASLGPEQPVQSQGFLHRIASRMGQIVSAAGASKDLRAMMTQAGYQGEKAATVFMGVKMLLFFAGLALGAALTYPLSWFIPAKIVVTLTAAAIGMFLPNFVVRARRAKRQANIRRHLPDAVDLLEICVSGGMGLEMAWNVVTDEISQVSMLLGDEMAFTNLDILLGSPRNIAMRHMSERSGCQEISSLAAALTQSEQFGTSIGETLRVFASTLREGRSQRAAEAAEKMSVKLLFPLIFLLFPAMFIVVVGPAAMELAKLLNSRR